MNQVTIADLRSDLRDISSGIDVLRQILAVPGASTDPAVISLALDGLQLRVDLAQDRMPALEPAI